MDRHNRIDDFLDIDYSCILSRFALCLVDVYIKEKDAEIQSTHHLPLRTSEVFMKIT